MNEVMQTLLNHRSYLKYSDRPVNENELQQIAAAVQAAPSWINGQQVTMIAVRDPERKQALAKYSGNQQHVAEAPVFLVFCADFYRAHVASKLENKRFDAVEHTDVLLVGATDVGLAMGNAIAAAASLGLGVRPIGGIRKLPLEVMDLLELPAYVIPIAGLCIGYPDHDPGQKPRLPRSAVFFEEKYKVDELPEAIQSYNKTYERYSQSQSADAQATRWSERVAGFYEDEHYSGQYRDIAEMLQRQGFPCKDMRS